MATTTTNFGWDIPQSTDLVKDGATAIAALGQDIDTALVDLKGGTTGQVLSKASGTDLDFTWVAQDDSNAIQNAIVDAKGDLIAATAADTPARLAVGTNGYVLTADSAEATGLKWSAVAGGLTLISPSSIAFSGTSASTSAGKTVFSACTSLSLNGVFTSTYENYLIIFSNLSQSGASMTKIRYRSSGTDTSTGYTTVQGYQLANAAIQYNPDSTDAHSAFDTNGTTVASCVMRVNNPQTATATTYITDAISNIWVYGKGRQSATNQYDGFTIFNASHNFTGTVRVYGLQN
jgi:hypothetical protein